jgi:hypothetical protein
VFISRRRNHYNTLRTQQKCDKQTILLYSERVSCFITDEEDTFSFFGCIDIKVSKWYNINISYFCNNCSQSNWELCHNESEVWTMSISRDNTPELNRDEYTEYIYDVTCFGDPINPENAGDVASGISRAMKLEARPVFLDGVSARLSQLGVACTTDDVELMLTEIKRRYK